MGEKRNYAALDWVIPQISDVLKEARQSLEAYVEDPKDETKIRFCLTQIHSVHGSIQMVEFHGASLLSEEMEHLAQAIMTQDVFNMNEAQEVLMRSLLQLPAFLEHVKSVKDDNPHTILPLLNDIRAARKQPYLSETDLFTPDLRFLERAHGTPHAIAQDAEKLAQLLKKLREMYQFAAAGVLRGIKVDENLGYIEKVFTRLEVVTRGSLSHPLWFTAQALVAGLRTDSIEMSVGVKGLFRYLARELRILGEKAPASLNGKPNTNLIKNILYYIARAESDEKRISTIRKKFDLVNALKGIPVGGDETALPQAEMEVMHDTTAIRSVVVALQDEMNEIKTRLDFSLSGQGSADEVREILPKLKRISDTLAVLGIANLRKHMLDQVEVLERATNGPMLDENLLMQAAGNIIEIDQKLEAISKVAGKQQDLENVDEREIEIDDAKLTVIKECRENLEKAKEHIVDYISQKWDTSYLERVESLLIDIRGGLDFIPLRRPANIVESCSAFIREQLVGGNSHPSWDTLETLADAVASVEYYLEHLSGDLKGDADALLDVAEESVLNLGYRITDLTESPIKESVPQDTDSAIETEAQVTQEDSEPVPDYSEPETHTDAIEPSIPEVSIQSFDSAETEESSAPSMPLAPAGENAADEDESDIDDEIKEIFIEEAGEVLETLNEYFPRWRENPDSEDDLTTVRRSFHTLKGSGRMVEAMVIGELAWSVENMLNRLIDGTVPFQEGHIFIVGSVIKLVPALVEGFKNNHQRVKMDLVDQYASWAHALSDGNIEDSLSSAMAVGDVDLSTPMAELPEAVEETVDQPVEPHVDESAAEIEAEDLALREIFSSETQMHLQTIESFIQEMDESAPIYTPPTDALQRALHTLKGSAKMAQINPIAVLAEPLENFAKELIAYQVAINEDILQLFKDIVEYSRLGLSQIDSGAAVEIPKQSQFVARTLELRENAIGHLIRMKEQSRDGEHQVDPQLLSIFMAEEMDVLLDSDAIIDLWGRSQGDNAQVTKLVEEHKTLANGARHANLLELNELSELCRRSIEQGIAGSIEKDGDYISALKQGHNALLDMVDAVAAGQNVSAPPNIVIEQLSQVLERSYETSIKTSEFDATEQAAPENDVSTGETANFGFAESNDDLPGIDGHFENNFDNDTPSEDTTIEASLESAYDEVLADTLVSDENPELTAKEADSGFVDSEEVLGGQQDATSPANDNDAFEDANPGVEISSYVDLEQPEVQATEFDGRYNEPADLPVVDENENAAGIVTEGDDSQVSENDSVTFVEHLDLENPADQDAIAVQDVEAGQYASDEHTIESNEHVNQVDAEAEVPAEGESLAPVFDEQVVAPHDAEQTVDSGAEEPAFESEPADAIEEDTVIPGLLDNIDVNDENYDQDIVEVFVEEADELTEELDENVATWENDWSDTESVEALKRALHTFKGGARLAGLTNLGEVAHEYESLIIMTRVENLDQGFFNKLHEFQDKIVRGSRAVRQFLDGGASSAIAGEMVNEDTPSSDAVPAEPITEQSPTGASAVESAPAEQTSVEQAPSDASNVVPFTPQRSVQTAEGDGEFTMPSVSPGGGGGQAAVAKKAGPQEVVRVGAELLEELVNLAGETSISRSRLEQYVTDFGYSLDEMDSTIARLQEQLRRLDIETEAQVLFRQEQMAEHEEFDPLEMDRYSALQHLSRSLIESSSDLLDLKEELGDKLRDTETLLVQQARINTNLQEGLMRSRMVPFSRMVPRLRRIVRQISTELGKNVSFELDNVEGELDRSVLERMVPPFEHMLRNAVDHGIETPEERNDAGKSETGRIVLALSREGSEVVIRLADDGRGVNLLRVKEKAIERGLMSVDAELSDHDIMQFILHAGFSTAESVTQISGRGVGMDVVHSEIKQLGGSMSINSKWGHGTEFVIRLPFTLSVNRALMVQIGQDNYAVPLSSIEGIVRVSPFELEHYYDNQDARFEYANENYHVRYLGSLLNQKTAKPNLDGHVLPLPVLLVRSAEHTMAIHVDALMGSREIVVKSLGQQFANVVGLSGATVMGDGSVVVIVDPHALVRQDIARASLEHMDKVEDALPAARANVVKTVMVVDDSVTVRKVTTRFLEREGFEVITAKDGVDALRVLQDQIPDVMLLDIEMPRMDGFEVAKNVRTTQRWKHLPIIMITSRTGDKHRDHALSLGVNHYIGKPYQEDMLLSCIAGLIEEAEKLDS